LNVVEGDLSTLRRRPGVLEREHELARLEAALEGARAEAGEFLIIQGPAGIGKTTLLELARGRAREHGMRVLSARASELERDFSYGVVRQLLGRVLRAASGKRRERLLDGAAAAAAMLEAEPGPDGSASFDAADLAASWRIPRSEYGILHGLWWLIANLAEERPLLIALDDIHWADLASLRFLDFLGRRVVELPALLLAAARPEGWQAKQLLPRLGCRPLLPAPLSPAACAQLVAARLGGSSPVDQAFSAACHTATGGNPFFLHALLDELARERVRPAAGSAARALELGPPAVRAAILARLKTLPAEAAGLARALAVLGGEGEAELASALAGLDPPRAALAAARLQDAALLAPSAAGAPLRFAHPIIRNAIYRELAPAERARRHTQAAALLSSRGAGRERIASHLLHGERGDARAVALLREAASEALASGAAHSALAYLRRALVEPIAESERAALLGELGLAALRVDGPAAAAYLREALARSASPARREQTAAVLAGALLSAGQPREAAQIASAALRDWPRASVDGRRRLQGTLLLASALEPSLAAERDQVRAQLRGVEREEGLGARFAQMTLALDDARRLLASAQAAAERIERAFAGGQLANAEGIPRFGALTVLAHADRDSALLWLERGLESARMQGDVQKTASLLLTGCLVHAVRGELQEAVADGEHGLELSRAWGADFGLGWGGAYLASAQLERGEIEAAERTLERAAAPGAELAQLAGSLPLLLVRARLHLACSRLDAGLEDALELGRRAQALAWRNPAFVPWRSLAAICLVGLERERERALALAREEVALARRWGAPRALGAALQALAAVEQGAPGEERLREALAVLEGSPARLERARALVALGSHLRRRGRRREARAPLRAGLELARTCGATGLAERAYGELRATGASPRKLIRTGADALTASERRVAGLAASGMSNKQIAQQLFVTVKTVESHLAQAYRKLEVSSRAQLAARLAAPQKDAVEREHSDLDSHRKHR
jgi:DNA-binding CsgD family transcriptional regulator